METILAKLTVFTHPQLLVGRGAFAGIYMGGVSEALQQLQKKDVKSVSQKIDRIVASFATITSPLILLLSARNCFVSR
jgi:hypothetical protein